MASAETILPRHIEASSLQQDDDDDDGVWPSLNVEKDEWEMVPPQSPQVTFEAEAIHIDEKKKQTTTCLKHAQSSPNLRNYIIEEEDDDSTSNASSSMVVVSETASVWSVGSSNRLTFRDAILQKQQQGGQTSDDQHQRPRKVIKKVRPRFVVTPIKRCAKSTGDLQALATHDEEEVVGDTDAHDYYSRKAQGAMGRKNGLKIRPDEAKRLQITMAKKDMQRQRQGIGC